MINKTKEPIKEIDYTNWSRSDLICLITVYQKIISNLQVIRECDKELLEIKDGQIERQEKIIQNMELLKGGSNETQSYTPPKEESSTGV